MVVFVLFWLIMFSYGCFAPVKRLACVIISEMVCNVSSQTLDPTQLNWFNFPKLQNFVYYFTSAVKSNQFQYFVKSTSNWPKTYSVTK